MEHLKGTSEGGCQTFCGERLTFICFFSRERMIDGNSDAPGVFPDQEYSIGSLPRSPPILGHPLPPDAHVRLSSTCTHGKTLDKTWESCQLQGSIHRNVLFLPPELCCRKKPSTVGSRPFIDQIDLPPIAPSVTFEFQISESAHGKQ